MPRPEAGEAAPGPPGGLERIRRARRPHARAAWIAAAVLFLAADAFLNLRHSFGGLPFTVRAAGKLCALLAAGLFLIQFFLSARLKALDRSFALDRLLKLHAKVGATAGVLAFLHPVLIYSQSAGLVRSGWDLWPEGLGAVALLIAMTIVATSLYRKFLELSWEAWRALHNLVFVMIAMVAVHSLTLGGDLQERWASAFWWLMLAAFAALFIYDKFYKPGLIRRTPYTVIEVTQVSHDTWNIELEAPQPGGFRQVPGQFAFLTLLRDEMEGGNPRFHPVRFLKLDIFGAAGPDEEHPFTISSGASETGRISFTVKESGDYTATIGQTRPGTPALVDGPYGQFSHLIRGEGDILMIAGGVGITPLLSMLRHIAAFGGPAVTLIWGNKTEQDILFRDEIEGFADEVPRFKVHHILSKQEDWSGPTGYVTKDVLSQLLSEEELSRRVFLCGPPVMMDKVTTALRALGVPRRDIHTERFAL